METYREPAAAYQGLIYNVFQQPRNSRTGGFIVCFTSATPGSGVTHIVRALANDLGEHSSHTVARVDLSYLQRQALPSRVESEGITELSGVGDDDGLDTRFRSRWHGSWKYRLDRINELRSQFEYVLIDCPALRASGDVLSVAPLADGIILVVEADRTTKSQVANAEKQILAAGGKLSGLILNKRKYTVPQWIYSRL
jgi:hypothetical protein